VAVSSATVPALPAKAPLPATVPDRQRAARLRCAARAAALTALFAAVLGCVLAASGPQALLPLDRRTDTALHAFAVAHHGWTRLNLVLTDWVWGPTTTRTLGLVVALALWLRGFRRQALWALAAEGLGWMLELAVKSAVGRARPHWPHPVDSATDASFPSGHTLAATVTCLTLLWLLRLHGVRGRWWAAAIAVGAVSAVGVGFTRLYLGVHWPSDVLAGWLLGGAVVTATAAVFAPWQDRQEGLARIA
jgi:membrane-associated phospholipid phosphatase